MKRFDYLAPKSLKEALAMRSDHPEAIPLAGGTDLLLQIKEGRRSAGILLSLKRIQEIHECNDKGKLAIGSAITLGQVLSNPRIRQDYTALSMGAGLIGSFQIRNVATLGGNLCNAAPSADTAPPLLVLGAQVLLVSQQGERLLPLETFFRGPGSTVLGSAELLTQILLPEPERLSGSFYLRLTPRRFMDIALAGAAAAVTLNPDGTIKGARLALGAVAPMPMRAREAEQLLLGRLPKDDLLRDAGALAAREAKPIDDLRASAEYRKHLVEVLTQRALRGALSQAKRGN
jgi:CO/xanthine dehydrogenase FAD-binding subunit